MFDFPDLFRVFSIEFFFGYYPEVVVVLYQVLVESEKFFHFSFNKISFH